MHYSLRSKIPKEPSHRDCRHTGELVVNGSLTNCPSMGFSPLRRIQTQAATYTKLASLGCATPSGFLNLLTFCSAHVLTALFHAESVLGVGALRGFPFPVAAAGYRSCPSSRVRTAREVKTWPRSEELGQAITRRRCEAQGFLHLESPFTMKRCYPDSTGRSSLSLFAPSRISPLEPWLRTSTKPPLMGFTTTQYRSVVMAALQSVKEQKG
jgi:hypothetical protein